MQPAEDLAPRGRGRARPVGARGREHGPPLGASAPWSRLLLPSACPYERERTRGRASVDGQLRVAGQGTGLHVSPQFLAPLEIQSVIHLETGSLQVWLSWDEVMLALGEPKPSLTGPCEDKALVRAEATGEEGPCGERRPHRAGPQRSAAGAWRGTSAQGPPRVTGRAVLPGAGVAAPAGGPAAATLPLAGPRGSRCSWRPRTGTPSSRCPGSPGCS